jgi:hypothetical protein
LADWPRTSPALPTTGTSQGGDLLPVVTVLRALVAAGVDEDAPSWEVYCRTRPTVAAEGQQRPPSSYWEPSGLNNKNRDRRERAAASVSKLKACVPP